MTPKEKAEELVDKFNLPSGLMSIERKQCALIAVDEIIEECSNWSGGPHMEWEVERYKYWTQVKNEIELL